MGIENGGMNYLELPIPSFIQQCSWIKLLKCCNSKNKQPRLHFQTIFLRFKFFLVIMCVYVFWLVKLRVSMQKSKEDVGNPKLKSLRVVKNL